LLARNHSSIILKQGIQPHISCTCFTRETSGNVVYLKAYYFQADGSPPLATILPTFQTANRVQDPNYSLRKLIPGPLAVYLAFLSAAPYVEILQPAYWTLRAEFFHHAC
jgi:hypothetical protein